MEVVDEKRCESRRSRGGFAAAAPSCSGGLARRRTWKSALACLRVTAVCFGARNKRGLLGDRRVYREVLARGPGNPRAQRGAPVAVHPDRGERPAFSFHLRELLIRLGNLSFLRVARVQID